MKGFKWEKIVLEKQVSNGLYILRAENRYGHMYTVSNSKYEPDRDIYYDEIFTPRDCGYQGPDELSYLIAVDKYYEYDPKYDEESYVDYSICTLNIFSGEQNFKSGIFKPLHSNDWDGFKTPEVDVHDEWFYKNSCLLLRAKDRCGEFGVNKNGELEYHFEYGLGIRWWGFETHDMQCTTTFAFDDFLNLILKVNGYYALGNVHSDIIAAKDINTRKYGYINKQGKVVIPFKYDEAGDFSPKYDTTAVKLNGQIYAIYRNGRVSESETEELRRDEETEELRRYKDMEELRRYEEPMNDY